MAASTRTSKIVPATPDAAYAAFLDPAALVQWLPPGEMTGQMHAFDGRVGGGYQMSLFYPSDTAHTPGKTEAHEDRVRVAFRELDPPRRIVQAVRFDSPDPAFGGEMVMTMTFAPAPQGTEVTILCENLPPGLRPQDNEEGTRLSLEQLARHLAR